MGSKGNLKAYNKKKWYAQKSYKPNWWSNMQPLESRRKVQWQNMKEQIQGIGDKKIATNEEKSLKVCFIYPFYLQYT